MGTTSSRGRQDDISEAPSMPYCKRWAITRNAGKQDRTQRHANVRKHKSDAGFPGKAAASAVCLLLFRLALSCRSKPLDVHATIRKEAPLGGACLHDMAIGRPCSIGMVCVDAWTASSAEGGYNASH